jgi:3-oxoadipate enol-lactonase
MNTLEKHSVARPFGALAVYVEGVQTGPAVVMAHSILSSSEMWETQSTLLAARGFFVVRVDARGHGGSTAVDTTCTMDDLAGDTVAVLDALRIPKAHYVGLSLGGMSGFGLGIRHGHRLLSLALCDCRADAPPAFATPWDERIAIARKNHSCAPLAQSTIERWFGVPFIERNPSVATRFRAMAAATSVTGFTACAHAIQQLDYLAEVSQITAPTTLIVGANDSPLPAALYDIRALMPGAVLEIIENAGHLPNVDQPEAFNAALLRHFDRPIP